MKRIAIIACLAASCSGGGKGKGSGEPAAETWTLVSVEAGDAACYVVVKDSTGAEYTHPGDFELCPGGTHDASNLVGFPVALSFTQGNILAAECEGDVDCGKSDTVKLVSAIDPVR